MKDSERYKEIRRLIRKKYGRRRPSAAQILALMKENKLDGKKKS